MSVIKILAINTVGLCMNGITTVIYDYYSRFDCEFEIHSITDGTDYREVIEKFNCQGIKIHYIPSRKNDTGYYLWSLIKLIKTEKFDLVHIHGNSATMSIELMAAKLGGCKIRIAHSHNSTCDHVLLNQLLKPLFHMLYTDAFACGNAAGQWLFGNRGFKIIKNGRDIKKFTFNQEHRVFYRQKLGLKDNSIAVGHIGNFNEQKNHIFLINVFNEIYKLNLESHLYLAGYGRCENSIRSLVDELGLKNNVHFMGTINNVPDLLQAMDIMLLPSLYEGLPLVVVEWQMAGLPCILSDSITTECVFTDLVRFLPLTDSYDIWARDSMSFESQYRSLRPQNANNIPILAKEHGYDIDTEAANLMKFYKNRLS
nr:glycosyltransferase family 1 protein [uncultured Eisenbergiella sp.]